jgi:hypothetical protein
MASGDLTDLATCHITCGLDGTVASGTDTILASLITAVSAYVPGVLNRNIAADNYIEAYRGNGKSQLLLRQRPIIALTSISWRGQAVVSSVDPITGGTGMWTDGRNACLTNGLCFPSGEQIRVAYSAGYTTIPADVSLAVAELVAEAYQRRQHVGEMSRSAQGAVTISFDSREMHAAIMGKLSNYMAGAPC